MYEEKVMRVIALSSQIICILFSVVFYP